VRTVSLYDGAAGRALLLAALARAGGEPGLGAAAGIERARFLAGLDGLADERAAPVGGFQGAGSWIWTLVWLDKLAGDPEALARARRLAATLDDPRLAADARLDVEGGAAGALLALLALHEASGDAAALERARAAGEHLLARAEPAPGGLAWRGEIGRPLAGFAHGAAGIARALGALARATGESRFAQAAAAALGFERGLYDERRGNWPVLLASGTLGEPRATWMTAWCHGAAGIGLARLLLEETLAETRLGAELEAALATTARAGARGDDHLCCGGGGRAAILLAAGQRRDREDWRAAALGLGAELVERAAAAGDFRLPRATRPGSESPWGLMRGRAGLAWLAAGLAGLDLPDVLALELPSEAASRRREGR
jgi:lantibiotic modifying enzyme